MKTNETSKQKRVNMTTTNSITDTKCAACGKVLQTAKGRNLAMAYRVTIKGGTRTKTIVNKMTRRSGLYCRTCVVDRIALLNLEDRLALDARRAADVWSNLREQA